MLRTYIIQEAICQVQTWEQEIRLGKSLVCKGLNPSMPAQVLNPKVCVCVCKRAGWSEKGLPHPHLSLKAEDGDRDGYHSGDDHCYDDSFGFIHTGEKEAALRWARGRSHK